ncbi:MAG: hypothetical protein HQL21_01640 [Candidatus Omnitrophica bacterium]|nr:hypothetical protein [Candidatus Omnitrophota bacterium]
MPSMVFDLDDRFSGSFILWTSFIASVWFSFVYFPGVFFADSYDRWNVFFMLVKMKGHHRYIDTALPSLWMGLSFVMTGSKAVITFFQSFLFFYSSLSVIRKMGNFKGGWVIIPSVAFLSFPLFQGYSVFNEPCVGTVIGVNFLFILLLRKDGLNGWPEKILYFFLYVLIFSTIFGFRGNTITILPVVSFVLWRRFRAKKEVLIPFISLVFALVFVFSLPYVLVQWRHVQRTSLLSFGIAWETVQIAKRTRDERYDYYLDYAGRTKGATRKAMGNVEESTWLGFFGKDALYYHKVERPDVFRKIMKDYWRLVCSHPKEFVENKVYIYTRILGISRPLSFHPFFGDLRKKLAGEGVSLTSLRRKSIDAVFRFMTRWDFLRRPYLIFLVGFLCLCLSWIYFRKDVYYVGAFYSMALFYYLAFFVTTQGFEFRYFFPSFFFITIIAIVVAAKAIELFLVRLNERRFVGGKFHLME